MTQPLRCPYDATLCQLPRCIGQERCSLDRRRGPGPSSERLPRVKVPDPERNAAERATLLRAALLMMARVIVVLDQGDQRLSVQARRLEQQLGDTWRQTVGELADGWKGTAREVVDRLMEAAPRAFEDEHEAASVLLWLKENV